MQINEINFISFTNRGKMNIQGSAREFIILVITFLAKYEVIY